MNSITLILTVESQGGRRQTLHTKNCWAKRLRAPRPEQLRHTHYEEYIAKRPGYHDDRHVLAIYSIAICTWKDLGLWICACHAQAKECSQHLQCLPVWCGSAEAD
eukprot:COSAG02_NODE_3275_length_7029_cov_17.536075_4_plen_105_part_00